MPTPSWQGGINSQTWAAAGNWSTGLVPIDGEAAHVANASSNIDVNSGFNQQAVELTSLAIPMTFIGTIGTEVQPAKTAAITRSGATATLTSTAHGYSNGDVVEVSGAVEVEYNGVFTISNVAANTFDYTVSGTPTTPATGTIVVRKTDYLAIGATTVAIGEPGGGSSAASGSPRLRLNFTTDQTAITVYNTAGSSSDTSFEPLIVLGTHASNVITVRGGRVGVATGRPGDTSTFATLNCFGGTLNIGPGVTWTGANVIDGRLTTNSAGTLVTQGGGTYVHNTGTLQTYNANGGTGTIWASTGIVNIMGGTVIHNAAITSSANMYGGELDLTQSNTARTVAALVLNRPRGAPYSVKLDNNHVTVTAITVAAGSRVKITVEAL